MSKKHNIKSQWDHFKYKICVHSSCSHDCIYWIITNLAGNLFQLNLVGAFQNRCFRGPMIHSIDRYLFLHFHRCDHLSISVSVDWCFFKISRSFIRSPWIYSTKEKKSFNGIKSSHKKASNAHLKCVCMSQCCCCDKWVHVRRVLWLLHVVKCDSIVWLKTTTKCFSD